MVFCNSARHLCAAERHAAHRNRRPAVYTVGFYFFAVQIFYYILAVWVKVDFSFKT